MEDSGGSFESLSTIQPKARRLDPFWATRLWQKLIKETKTAVKVSRQRYFLKNYDDVFKGDDLVEVVLDFLKECTAELDVQRIERSNALKVCQVLMGKKLFESVVPKGIQKFEDGSNKFYRFIPDETTDKIITKDTAEQHKENRTPVPERVQLFSPCPNGSRIFTPDISKCHIRKSLRLKTPLMRVKDTKPSPVRFSKRVSRDADEALTVQRDTAFSLLLHLVDIPVLESILSVPHDLPELPESPQPFVLEQDFTPRKRRPPTHLDSVGPVAELPWVRAASACLGGLHPAGIECVWSAQAAKVLCYKSVCERFSCSGESIIPGEYFSVCIPIVGLLRGERRGRDLLALQLLVLHLPCRRRRQLQQLLHFLHLVVEDLFVCVDKRITNYEAVVRDFLPVVFKHPLVSEETQKILFDYILLKSRVIFQPPDNIQQFTGSDLLFCKTTPASDYDSSDYTQKCLMDLASDVADSTDIKLADKKSFLKKLKKHHTPVYENCHLLE